MTQTLGKKTLMWFLFKQCSNVLLKPCAPVFVCLRILVWGVAKYGGVVHADFCWLHSVLKKEKEKKRAPHSGWVLAENNTLLHVCAESFSTKCCKGPAKASLQSVSTADRMNLELGSPCEVALDVGLLSEILLYEYPVSELCSCWGQPKPLTHTVSWINVSSFQGKGFSFPGLVCLS